MSLLALFALGQMPDAQFQARIKTLAAAAGPGVAMAVYRDGKQVYANAFGVADEKTKAPYRTDLGFEIGSLSKEFTATAILMLVKQGKLSLDDPIGKYLPEVPETWRAAKIEQVLHHMSGIPDYEEIAGYDFYNSEHKPEEIIAEAAKKPLDFQPGASFSYSNTGYYLLGMIVSRASGQPIGDFLEERLFKPMGMSHTYTIHRPKGLTVATGYHSRTGTRTAQPPIAWSSTYAAGGIVSTLADMEKWDQGLYTSKLLPDNLRNRLWTGTTTTSGDRINYGYGWFVSQYRWIPRLDHSGQTNGFTCFYLRFPELHAMLMVQTNTYDGGVGPIASALAAHFVTETNLLKKGAPADPEPGRTAMHLALFKTVATGQGDMSLFDSGMQNFATKDQFKDNRNEIKAQFDAMTTFSYVTAYDYPRANGKANAYVYRMETGGKTLFWTLRFFEGKLIGMTNDLE